MTMAGPPPARTIDEREQDPPRRTGLGETAEVVGLGAEGIQFSFADKPKFAPFVMDVIGVDVTKPAPGSPNSRASTSRPRSCRRPSALH